MIQRPGIHNDFPSPREYLQKWHAAVPEPIGKVENLRRYAEEGKFALPSDEDGLPKRLFDDSSCQGELRRCANDIALRAVTKALSGDPTWHTDWQRAIAYFQSAFQLEFQFHNWVLRQYEKGLRRQRLALIPLDDVVWITTNSWLLGWKETGFKMLKLAMHGLDRQFFTGRTQGMRRAHFFCLRLLASYLSTQEGRQWPSFAFDEPIYETLLAHWSAYDETALEVPLLAACDRHTHQAQPDSASKFHDFRRYPQMYQPFEVLLIFRLRQWEGLALPIVDHPLLSTPLGELQEEVPEYSDALLRAVVARAEEERPKDP